MNDEEVVEGQVTESGASPTPSEEPVTPPSKKVPINVLLILFVILGVFLLSLGNDYYRAHKDKIPSGVNEQTQPDKKAPPVTQEALAGQKKAAIALAEKLLIPNEWKPVKAPEVKMGEDAGRAWTFYSVSYKVPSIYKQAQFDAWFKAQPLMKEQDTGEICLPNPEIKTIVCTIDTAITPGIVQVEKQEQALAVTFSTADSPIVYIESYSIK